MYACFVCVCFFSCVLIVVFDLVLAKSVFHVFCFLFFCVPNRSLLFVVYNFLCVFVHVCWYFHMSYVITLFPHWFAMKICMYSFLRWEILLNIWCLYCAGECWCQFLDVRGLRLLGFLFLFFALYFSACIVLYNFVTGFVFLTKHCCFPRLFPCHPFSAFCCVGWHVDCPFFTAAFYFPVYFFVFLLFKYILRGLDTPFSHSHTPPAPLWSPWSDLPPSCFF